MKRSIRMNKAQITKKVITIKGATNNGGGNE